MVGIGYQGSDFDLGIDAAELAGGGLGLGQILGNILLIEEGLPLKVIQFDKIAVHNGYMPDPGPDDHLGLISSQSAATNKGDLTFGKSFLA